MLGMREQKNQMMYLSTYCKPLCRYARGNIQEEGAGTTTLFMDRNKPHFQSMPSSSQLASLSASEKGRVVILPSICSSCARSHAIPSETTNIFHKTQSGSVTSSPKTDPCSNGNLVCKQIEYRLHFAAQRALNTLNTYLWWMLLNINSIWIDDSYLSDMLKTVHLFQQMSS